MNWGQSERAEERIAKLIVLCYKQRDGLKKANFV